MRPMLSYSLRFAGYSFSSHRLLLMGIAAGLQATSLGCATGPGVRSHAQSPAAPSVQVAGIWDGTVRQTLTDGVAAGDTREERQEWHLDQRGRTVSGYYMATLTFTSGDGRPYVCSRQPQFSAVVRVDVRGNLNGNSLSLVELAQRTSGGPCALGDRPPRHRRTALLCAIELARRVGEDDRPAEAARASEHPTGRSCGSGRCRRSRWGPYRPGRVTTSLMYSGSGRRAEQGRQGEQARQGKERLARAR